MPRTSKETGCVILERGDSMKKLLAIPLILMLSTVCSGMGRRGSIPDGQVTYSVILSGQHSRAVDFQVKLVTSQSEWEQVWDIARGSEEPLPKIPTVNFKRENVIAAFMGQRNSSGYKIEITSIEKKSSMLKVFVKKYETPGMLPVVTHPFTLVRMTRGNFKIEVIEETVQ